MKKQQITEERTLSKFDILSIIAFVFFLVLLPISVTNYRIYLENRNKETAAETETEKPKQPKKSKTEFILFHYKQSESYE
ncbi:hypothetical protein V9L05_08750 [Bernardetia sp. Wsw4-3y2]|uniref:hypothetical protein n=1 Tax=Bernardetia sp. Wsw4-3y2 TaxID=3127471 RepID=UPI0030D5F323